MSFWKKDSSDYRRKYEMQEEQVKSLKRDIEDLVRRNDRDAGGTAHEHKLAVANLKNAHFLEMQQKEFDLKHYKDDELQKAQKAVTDMEKELAVVRAENKMLDEISDWNKDIIDVKDLVSNLINKLPEIKISNLGLTAPISHKE